MARQLINDLVVAFGFSKENAKAAVWLYNNEKLETNLMDDIFYLERNPWNQIGMKEMPSLRPEMIERLERLNYQITQAGGHAV